MANTAGMTRAHLCVSALEDPLPDVAGLSKEEAAPQLDGLLEKILSRGFLVIVNDARAQQLCPAHAAESLSGVASHFLQNHLQTLYTSVIESVVLPDALLQRTSNTHSLQSSKA
eukprot:6484159-Amphidinium_carterae.2